MTTEHHHGVHFHAHFHSVPKPPPGLDIKHSGYTLRRRAGTTRVEAKLALSAANERVHHWEPGPQDVPKLSKPVYQRGRKFTHRYRWYLHEVRGTTRSRAAEAMYEVLHHQFSWERTGVLWTRTYDPGLAHIWVSFVPMSETPCGSGAAGCYSWGYHGRPPQADIGVEYMDDKGALAELINMELIGHGTFRMLDMYNAVHQPYAGGCMGTWADAARFGYYPSQQEIDCAVEWLKGETPAAFLHDD